MTTGSGGLLERTLVPATSRIVLTWPVVVTTVIFSVFIHLFGSGDIARAGIAERALAAGASMAPMFLIIAVVQRIPEHIRWPRVLAVLASYAVGGAARGVTLSLLLHEIGGTDGDGWRYRVPAGALNMGSIVFLVTFGWAVFHAYRNAITTLLLETRKLQAALEQLEVEARADTLRQLSDVSAGIVRELQSVEVHPAGAQVLEIQRVIDERVRPLSREFAADLRQWAPDRFTIGVPSMREIWAKVNPGDHLLSPWFALIVSIAPFPLANARFGWLKAAELTVLLFATLWPAVFIGNVALRRALATARSPWRELLITSMFLTVAAFGVTSTYVVLRDTAAPATFVLAGLVTFPMYSWVALVGLTYWADARRQEQRLLQVRADLTWAIARVNLLHWFNRGVITRLLHGPIQNAMHATVIRLRSKDPDTVVAGVIAELRQRILDVDTMLLRPSDDAAEVGSQLETLARVWSGIADVDIEVSPAARRALGGDHAGATIVLDLCQEAVSNAIRHGAARQLRVQFDLATRVLVMRITDDGRVRPGGAVPGIGSQFLDTVSIDWTRTREGDANTLTIRIPLDADH